MVNNLTNKNNANNVVKKQMQTERLARGEVILLKIILTARLYSTKYSGSI